MKTFNCGCIGWVWIWLSHSKPNTDLFFQKKGNLNEKKKIQQKDLCTINKQPWKYDIQILISFFRNQTPKTYTKEKKN